MIICIFHLISIRGNFSHKWSLSSWKKPTLVWVKISEKNNNIFSSLRSHYHRQANRKELLLSLKEYFNTSKLWRTWSLALLVYNFFFKVDKIMLKYGNLMLPAWHILDLYCVRLLNAAPFYENYTKRGRGGGLSFCSPFFKKEVPFLAIIERCPVLCFSCKNTFVGAGNLQMITSKF